MKKAIAYLIKYTKIYRKENNFEIRDQILLNSINLGLEGSKKLSIRFVGPCPVVLHTGSVDYYLQILVCIHGIYPILNVSLFYQFTIDRNRSAPPKPRVGDTRVLEYKVHNILRHGTKNRRL